MKTKGIVGRDVNKPNKPEVAEMGGIAVVLGFFAGVGVLLALEPDRNTDLLNVSLSAIFGAAFVGMIDDVFDLRQRHKAFLPFVLALPFGASVDSVITIPHIAQINFGPWMIIASAFAITCAANAANMLEGFNGLGTGLGIIMASTLVLLSLSHNRTDGIYVLIPLLGALLAFLWFNKYPAKVFPGDTMLLFMGATIAAAGILSSLHVQTVFIFLPMITEFFLKLRGGFRGESFSSATVNGYLLHRGRIESLTHVFMRGLKVTEKGVVHRIWLVEALFCATVLLVDTLLL